MPGTPGSIELSVLLQRSEASVPTVQRPTVEQKQKQKQQHTVNDIPRRTPHHYVLMSPIKSTESSEGDSDDALGRRGSNDSSSTIKPGPRAHQAGSSNQQQRRISTKCTLWVHDENFSKEDVILNASMFPEGSLQVGDLAEIIAFTADLVTQAPEAPEQSTSSGGAATREKGSGDPLGPTRSASTTTAGDLDGGDVQDASERNADGGPSNRRGYVFLVKNLNNEQRARQSNLQVGSLCHWYSCGVGLRTRFRYPLPLT